MVKPYFWYIRDGRCLFFDVVTQLYYTAFILTFNIWKEHYFFLFLNRWTLLVSTIVLKISSLFGMYIEFVNYIPPINLQIFEI